MLQHFLMLQEKWPMLQKKNLCLNRGFSSTTDLGEPHKNESPKMLSKRL